MKLKYMLVQKNQGVREMSFKISEEYLKKREIEKIKEARKQVEMEIKDFLKEKFPKEDIDSLKFKWKDLEWIPNWLKEGLKE